MTTGRDPDVEYWFHQARAYVNQYVDADLGVTGDHENGVVLVRPPETYDREGMAEIIRRLEHSGFTVDSTTQDEHVAITVTSERLTAPYETSRREPTRSEPADFGHGESTEIQDL